MWDEVVSLYRSRSPASTTSQPVADGIRAQGVVSHCVVHILCLISDHIARRPLIQGFPGCGGRAELCLSGASHSS